MTLLYYDPVFLEHDTGGHPEHASRLTAIVQQLRDSSCLDACRQVRWTPASEETVCSVHTAEHLQRIRRWCAAAAGRVEQDTVVSARSCEAALMAAGAVCDAVKRVMDGEDRSAVCLVRPPGHHALPTQVMGFCLLNNAAIAARWAIRHHGLERILIVDWDVHHGNGTQAIFWEDPRVGFYSIHRWPFYPGTGAATEAGAGPGQDTTRNVPIEFGTSRSEYVATFSETLSEFANQMRPQLVLVSAGFDAHKLDPIGSLGLEAEDFGQLTRHVLRIAAQYAQGRVVSTLEGGYHPAALAQSTLVHLQELTADGQG